MLAEITDNLLGKYVRYSGLASELDQIRDKLKVIKTEVQGPFENLICLNENEISIDGNITRSRLGIVLVSVIVFLIIVQSAISLWTEVEYEK